MIKIDKNLQKLMKIDTYDEKTIASQNVESDNFLNANLLFLLRPMFVP